MITVARNCQAAENVRLAGSPTLAKRATSVLTANNQMPNGLRVLAVLTERQALAAPAAHVHLVHSLISHPQPVSLVAPESTEMPRPAWSHARRVLLDSSQVNRRDFAPRARSAISRTRRKQAGSAHHARAAHSQRPKSPPTYSAGPVSARRGAQSASSGVSPSTWRFPPSQMLLHTTLRTSVCSVQKRLQPRRQAPSPLMTASAWRERTIRWGSELSTGTRVVSGMPHTPN